MKTIYKKLLGIGLGLIFTVNSIAQGITESFENVSTLASSGWVMNNLSTPIGSSPTWIQGTSNLWPAKTGNGFISANYNNVAGAGDISNWLISPVCTFNNGDVFTFWTRTANPAVVPDNMEVRLSLNGTSTNVGTTNASVGDFSTILLLINPSLTLLSGGYPTAWTQYTVTISGLSAPTTGRLAFRYALVNGGPNGSTSDVIGIDDFMYAPAVGGGPNVSASNGGEYTLIPLAQANSINLGAIVSNNGISSATDAQLKVNVYQASNLNTPILTVTSPAAAITAGSSASLTAGTFTPSLGNYVCKFISLCTGNTVTSSDTSTYAFSVVNNFYARDNGISVLGVGADNGTSSIIGTTFKITKTTTMDSVLFVCNPGVAGLGDTVRVRIANTTAGVPSNTGYIGQSLGYKFTAANTNTALITPITLKVRDLSSNPLVLAPGTYFVGIEKYATGANYALRCTNDIYTENTVYGSINNGSYSTLNSLLGGFNNVPIIRPFLTDCISSPTITLVTNNSSLCVGQTATLSATGGISYLWNTNQTTMDITVTPSVNTLYTVTGTDVNGCKNVATITQSVSACSTSINNLTSKESSVQLYPNPNNGVFTVELTDNSKIIITDALGREVMNTTFNAGKSNIKLNEPSGTYFVKVVSDNKEVIKYLFITK